MFPQEVREPIFELYGFCRVTDDMIDECELLEEKKLAISLIQKYLDAVYKTIEEDLQRKELPFESPYFQHSTNSVMMYFHGNDHDFSEV
jgi:phytoene/squalene synthetase